MNSSAWNEIDSIIESIDNGQWNQTINMILKGRKSNSIKMAVFIIHLMEALHTDYDSRIRILKMLENRL